MNNALVLNQNNIGYAGEVKISYPHNGYKRSVYLHNAGTPELGNILSQILAGDFRVITNNTAGRIVTHLGFSRRQGNADYSLLTSNPPITSSVWGSAVPTNSNSAFYNNSNIIGKNRFSSVISYNLVIKGININDSSVLKLSLFSNEGLELATIEDTEHLPALYQALVNGQDALIDWTMYLLNYNGG